LKRSTIWLNRFFIGSRRPVIPSFKVVRVFLRRSVIELMSELSLSLTPEEGRDGSLELEGASLETAFAVSLTSVSALFAIALMASAWPDGSYSPMRGIE